MTVTSNTQCTHNTYFFPFLLSSLVLIALCFRCTKSSDYHHPTAIRHPLLVNILLPRLFSAGELAASSETPRIKILCQQTILQSSASQSQMDGAQIFCSACSLFCMQLHCERQFNFIFLGKRQFYFLFFLGEHEFWKKINSMWFLSFQK
jgi:hypothetical protein